MKNKDKRNKILFGVFIIFLMISSTAGFIYSGNSTKKINGFKFTNNGASWQVWVEDIDSYLVFKYLPTEIDEDFSFLDNKSKFKVYNDNWSEDSLNKLRTVLVFINIRTEIEETINCEEDSIVLTDSSSEININKEGKCFYLNGDSTKFIEGVTYKVFEVI